MKDFEIMWQNKLRNALSKLKKVNLWSNFNKEAQSSIHDCTYENRMLFTDKILNTFKKEISEDSSKNIFLSCACTYNHDEIKDFRELYKSTNDISLVHKALENKFRTMIKEYKKLSDSQVNEIISNGWGMAGLLNDNTIIATKIPSMYHEYFSESDESMKKYYYCHCPRVRDIFKRNEPIPSNMEQYCYCGGGFYKDMWEYILDKKVDITLEKSLFKNNNVCQFKINV